MHSAEALVIDSGDPFAQGLDSLQAGRGILESSDQPCTLASIAFQRGKSNAVQEN